MKSETYKFDIIVIAGQSNAEGNGIAVIRSADDIHFSAVALKELGKRYFDKYSEIINAE